MSNKHHFNSRIISKLLHISRPVYCIIWIPLREGQTRRVSSCIGIVIPSLMYLLGYAWLDRQITAAVITQHGCFPGVNRPRTPSIWRFGASGIRGCWRPLEFTDQKHPDTQEGSSLPLIHVVDKHVLHRFALVFTQESEGCGSKPSWSNVQYSLLLYNRLIWYNLRSGESTSLFHIILIKCCRSVNSFTSPCRFKTASV